MGYGLFRFETVGWWNSAVVEILWVSVEYACVNIEV